MSVNILDGVSRGQFVKEGRLVFAKNGSMYLSNVSLGILLDRNGKYIQEMSSKQAESDAELLSRSKDMAEVLVKLADVDLESDDFKEELINIIARAKKITLK